MCASSWRLYLAWLPLKWTAEDNVAWKLAMPAWSGSTPVIWRDRIFLNVADADALYLWCVDKTKGAVLWKKLLGSGNVKMRKQNMSSPSPVTDGNSVYVMTGTGILKGFDFNGTYNSTVYPAPTGIAFASWGQPYRGQPSIVYAVHVTVGTTT